MDNLIQISQQRIFSREQASDLLPLVYRITEEAQLTVKKLILQRDTLQKNSNGSTSVVEGKISEEVTLWENKMRKLGLFPKGLWLVDFDNGQGYFCWKFPEIKIDFQHAYTEGFTGRKVLDLQ